jgi:hypothetical protein
MKKKMILGLIMAWGCTALFAQEAVIREARGTVEVKAPGETVWSAAREGQSLKAGTMISTGFRSAAVLAIGGSTLNVQPLTRLALEELVRMEKSEKVDIHLRTGRIRANVKPPARGNVSLNVRSPIATASVRGTDFEFDGLRLRVEEGRVHLDANGGGTYVGAGHLAKVDTQTGHVAGVAETAKEELTPPAPAGMDSTAEVPAAAPAAADVDTGLEWK